MLNEKEEYNLYLSSPDYGGLIRADNLLENLSGMKHVLEILARGFLGKCKEAKVTEDNEKYQYCTEFLKIWLAGGLNALPCYQGISNYPLLQKEFLKADKNNLKRYLISLGFDNKGQYKFCKLFSAANKKACTDNHTALEKLDEYWKNKISALDKSMFFSTTENSQNQIYFKTVIADAIHKGPLTEKIMVLKKGKDNFGLKGDFKQQKRMSILLAIVGVYLQNKYHNQESVPVNFAQISNMVGLASSSRGKGKELYSVSGLTGEAAFAYKGKPLFVKSKITDAGNKLRVNPEWLKDFDVHLIYAEERFDRREYTSFSDDFILV